MNRSRRVQVIGLQILTPILFGVTAFASGADRNIVHPMNVTGMSKLEGFTGTWETVETHEANDWSPGGEGTGISVTSLGPGGLSIIEDYRSSVPFAVFDRHVITAWNAKSGTYVNYLFDSAGVASHQQTCRWVGSDFVCEGEATTSGKTIFTRSTTTEISSNSRKVIYEITSSDGRMRSLMIIKYRRKH